jgi:hypothetical protein
MGYITHKIDFGNLWAAFKERTVREDEEVLIFWTRRNYKRFVKLFSAGMPKLIVVICHKGAFDLFDPSYMPELTGDARAKAMAPIAHWKPDVMK